MKKRPNDDKETSIDDEETHPSNTEIDSDGGEIHTSTKEMTSHSKETHVSSKETHSDDEEIDAISNNLIEMLILFYEEMCLTAFILTIKAVRTYLSEVNRQTEQSCQAPSQTLIR